MIFQFLLDRISASDYNKNINICQGINDMWDFIKYCLYCFGIVISGSFGNNPEGMSIKTGIIGIITMFVLLGLALGILWLIAMIVNKFR